jgi:hypothetical protein
MKIKKKVMEEYLSSAEQLIGKRTPGEIAHDDAVVAGLEMGLPIELALTRAAEQHPSEKLLWNSTNISDIAAHYDHIRGHMEILQKLSKIR